MRYSVDINRDMESMVYCLQEVRDGINNIYDWRISVNAGGIDYGIYFNFDIERKELEICNQPDMGADDSLGLEEIIEIINGDEEE